jgi:hypothetical protein
MKISNCLILIAGMIILTSSTVMNTPDRGARSAAVQSAEFYQLKIYTFSTDEQMTMTDNYLRDAFLPGIKRLGIKNVGVFKTRLSVNDTVKKTYLLIPFTSFSQFQKLEEGLARDGAYLAAGKEYLEAKHDRAPYRRMESILLEAFEDMPFIKAPDLDGERSQRVYELRSYESPTEAYHNLKVDMFNAGGEMKLFERLQFNAIFYGRVISGSKMPNLMYMTSFSGEASRNAHWDAFSKSPEWAELKAMPKYLNTVSHIDIRFLYPADYSDY